MTERKLGNWLESWIEYTEPLPSPPLWRKWAGIFILGAAMERRIHIKTSRGVLFPHLYLLFVGPPGVGKTLMTAKVGEFLKTLNDISDANSFHIASSSVTHASVIDELEEAKRTFVLPRMEDTVKYNSLTLISNELGVLLPEYDAAMMSKLTDLYDGFSYSESRRTKDRRLLIEAPQLSLLAATTPSFLTDTLPPGAWDQGFLSRSMIAFSAESLYRDLFEELPITAVLEADLLFDLRHIFSLFGKMTFTEEAVKAISTWDRNGRLPIPDHPKLMHYNTRRASHVLKLCMIAAMAKEDTLQITIDHFHTALDWLIEIEYWMPEIFKAMSTGGDGRVMEEVWYHINLLYNAEQKPIAESRILAFLAERLPAAACGRVLEIMVKTEIFEEQFTGNAGNWYVPRTKRIN